MIFKKLVRLSCMLLLLFVRIYTYSERGFACDDEEQELYDNCLMVVERRGELFNNNSCPKGYSLHVLGGRDEAKWIAIIFRKLHATWIGNSGDNARFLKPKLHPNAMRIGLNTTEGKPIFVRLTQGARDGTKRGCAYYGTEALQLPYICSRKAEPYDETQLSLKEFLEELGFPLEVILNKDGNERIYTNFGLQFAVEAEHFEANVKNLHNACYALPKGFVASRDDFLNVNEFNKVMEKFRYSSFRVPKGRSPTFSMKADKCEKEKFFMTNRKYWSYYDKNGDRFEIKTEYWKNTYPDNMCADLPRITVMMMMKGYIDIPAMGRRSVLCTTGGPEEANRGPLRKGESCNRAATYDPKTKQCVCDIPETDGRLLNPSVYGHYPPGIICLSCKESKKKRSIVFVFDRSGSVDTAGVHQELRFMKEVAKNIKGTRTGAVMQTDNPYIALEMGQWDSQTLTDFVAKTEKKHYEPSWTVIGHAMFLGREMLEKETTEDKIMVLFSDGQPDLCVEWEDGMCTDIWNWMMKHEQYEQTEELRKKGIQLLYVPVGPRTMLESNDYDPDQIERIKKMVNFEMQNVIEQLDLQLLEDTVKVICQEKKKKI